MLFSKKRSKKKCNFNRFLQYLKFSTILWFKIFISDDNKI
jgi:hypothetical protein